MIRTKLLSAQGQYRHGDAGLIDQWREQGDSILWLDIEGELTAEIQELLVSLKCDRLAIADCSRLRHPPKVEEFDHDTFILFRGMSGMDEELNLQPMPVGMWISERLLITAHPGHAVSVGHFWDSEQEQKLLKTPNILAMRILHYVGGRYLEKLMEFEDTLAGLEDALLADETDTVMKELVVYRSRLRKLLRVFSYHRYYEICGDLVESHISITSHHLNNTIKVLTIITAVFIPITFIAGLYGMNFQHIPELQWRYGYFAVLGLMLALVIGMLALFRKIRWL